VIIERNECYWRFYLALKPYLHNISCMTSASMLSAYKDSMVSLRATQSCLMSLMDMMNGKLHEDEKMSKEKVQTLVV
jgi:hypothetical protein